MSSARYAPLPNPRSTHDAEREMDEAFDDDNENTPLTVNEPPSNPPREAVRAGTYDFERERDYDHPPPGSPPAPSSFALPNTVGNSNGLLPTSPIVRSFNPARPSFFRRTVNALLPSYYQRIQNQPEVPGHGSGMNNDGVFTNVMAKPSRPVAVQTDDGEVYMVPEETQAEAPPSYAAASADAAPAYWETTVHAPPPINLNGDMVIDELPTGSFFTFVFTALISWFFQFPGFLLTYLLHGTHASRFGSQAGLAITLIQFGFGASIRRDPGDDNNSGGIFPAPGDGDQSQPAPSDSPSDRLPSLPDPLSTPGNEWISFLLMTIGWFLLLTSIIGYVRVKRFEMSIRAAHTQGAAMMSPESIQRDAAMRRNLEEVFGITIHPNEPEADRPPARNENEARLMRDEARLERDLRAAGFL